jgi:hypothetical protein
VASLLSVGGKHVNSSHRGHWVEVGSATLNTVSHPAAYLHNFWDMSTYWSCGVFHWLVMVAHNAALYSGQSLKHGAARGTVLINASPVKRLRTSHMIGEGQLASPGNALHWLVDFDCVVATLVGKLKSEAPVRFRAVRVGEDRRCQLESLPWEVLLPSQRRNNSCCRRDIVLGAADFLTVSNVIL